MIGFRGASKYHDSRYADGSRWNVRHCSARGEVRPYEHEDHLDFHSRRTVDEGRRVLAMMAQNGLHQGEDGLEVYALSRGAL